MYFGFETSNPDAGLGALLVYGIWRSRDQNRLKITPEIWGTVERAVKSSAKRALDLHDFIERLKPKLGCAALRPKWMQVGESTVTMKLDPTTGELIEKEDPGRREFWAETLETADHRAVLDVLYRKTSWIIALVRDRLERERPLEAAGLMKVDEEGEIAHA